jgi:hypothetical protein
MSQIDASLLALHTHWIRADSIKERVGLQIPENGDGLPQSMQELGQQMSKIHALEVLYGLIFVVIEGFRDLKCKDERVERLLAAENYVDLLRRFRNGVFHYQTGPMDPRLVAFMTRENSEKWIREIHSALGAFLERELPIKEGIERYKAMFSEGAGATAKSLTEIKDVLRANLATLPGKESN